MGGDSVASAPARSQSGRGGYHSSSASVQSHRSTKSSKSLQLGLEKIDRASGKGSKKKNGGSSGSRGSDRSGHSYRSAPVISSSRSLSSRHSASSRNSAPMSNTRIRLEQISEKSALKDPSVDSSSSSWRKPYEPESSASVSGTASVSSRRSTTSSVTSASKASSSGWSSSNGDSSSRTSRTSKSSKTTNTSNVRAQDDPSVASHHSSSSSRGTRSSASTKQTHNTGHLSSSARGNLAQGVEYLKSNDYSRAILLFTDAIAQANKKDKASLATLHGYRSEALYEIGAYEASAKDARNALECERSSGPESAVDGHPYVRSSSNNGGKVHPDSGPVLRARALAFLGLSLLRQGITDGVADALGDCMSVAKRALEDAEDLSSSERKSPDTQRAVKSAKDSMDRADEGLTLLGRYEKLTNELDSGSYNKKDYLDILDDAIEIAPAATGHHTAKIKYLVGCRKWFMVANHCERLAADAVKRDAIYRGDLAQLDPYPGASPAQELSPDFFTTDGSRNEIPLHLRVLSPKAARDAVFRMPERLLPYYLRSLRLEERYKAAVMAGTALAEFDAHASEQGRSNPFAENKRFHSEWDKLDRTIKIKEEGDSLFRDGYHDRAVKLYGECLSIDGEDENGRGSSILRPASSWPVACTKPNEAGGKLHAVLHSNRAACFTAMGREDDAIKESSHALQIHTMYVKALLRRARCYAKTGQRDKAKADFGRFIVLVDGAREFPYPPPNQGSSCYFDMPSNVSYEQLESVKMEMKDLGIKVPDSGRGRGMGKKPSLRVKTPSFNARSRSRSPSRSTSARSKGSMIKLSSFTSKRSPRSVRSNSSSKGGLLSMFSCCMKDSASQVEMRPSQPSNWPQSRGANVSGNKSSRRVSWSWSTQKPAADSNNPPLIKSRPAFEHPLDPPSEIDYNVDYYAILDLSPSATDSEIKKAYHKLAREYHPDRNDEKEARERFDDLKMAYAILGDNGKKREYDRATKVLEP